MSTGILRGTPRHVIRSFVVLVGILLVATACSVREPTEPSSQAPSGASPDSGVPGSPLPSLPRVAWEGGPGYWAGFERAKAAGWAEHDFFPIVAWFNSVSTDAEAAYDKSLGINTYIGMPDTTPYSTFADNGVFYIGPRLNDTYDGEATNWVGQLLGDEADGRFPDAAAGQEFLRQQAARVPPGFFRYANFTQVVIGKDIPDTDARAYVNDFTDVVSMDMYWYTVPYCSLSPYRDNYLVPIEQEFCRTASSYGKSVKAMRVRDQADGKLQPIWQFVENFNGGPEGEPLVATIRPEQLEGAVMSSLINEARGIVYFNQSLSGNCRSGNVFRESQVTPGFCAAEQVAAAGRINGKIRDLAEVLNTQSYSYDFGGGLQTMLKVYDGSAYVFAMIDGSHAPGDRDFRLPAGITGRTIDVLYENRNISAKADGTFVDSFPHEAAYHIYKVGL